MNIHQALLELDLDTLVDRDTLELAHKAHIAVIQSGATPFDDERRRRLDLAFQTLVEAVETTKVARLSAVTANSNLPVPLIISLDQAIHGGEVVIDIPGHLDVFSKEGPSIRIAGPIRRIRMTLPKGLRAGTHLKLTSEVEGGSLPDTIPETVYEINITCPEGWRLEGGNLYTEISLNALSLAYGASQWLDLAIGPIHIEIPRHTKDGTIICIKGGGLPACDDQPSGDLWITVKAEARHKLPAKTLLSAFAEKWA